MGTVFELQALKNYKDFEGLTYGFLKNTLLKSGDKKVYAVGAEEDSKNIGLILAELNEDGISATIHSIFVTYPCRRRKYGSDMLELMCKRLKNAGIRYVNFYYYLTKNMEANPFREFLLKHGFSEPVQQLITCVSECDRKKILEAGLIKNFRVPSSFSLLSFNELSVCDFEQIKNEVEYPNYLSPFQEEESIFKPCSFILRYKNKVVGWNIVHRISEDILRYSGIFVEDSYRTMGGAYYLMSQSIKAQIDSKIPTATFAVNLDNEVMMKFANKYFKECMLNCSRGMMSFREL